MESKVGGRRNVLMLVSAMLIWGTIGIFRKYIPVSSAFLAFSRGMLGGLFMLAFVLVRRKKRSEKLQLSKTLLLALTGAAMGINWILLFEAYNYTSVAVATLCYYMEPTIVMLLSPFIFKERLSAKRAVCAAVAIVGMVLISGVIGGGQTGSVKGVLLGLGAAVLYSAVVIMNKRISGLDAYSKTAIELMSAGAVMIPYMLLTGGAAAAGFDARTVILLLTVGLIHTGVAYLLYFGSMDGLKAQSIAILSYIDPVSALLFSALFLKEALSLLTVIGAILIIGSAVAGEMHTDRK